MRILLLLSLALTLPAWAAEELDPKFWAHYEPYRQYSSATMEDLGALDEGDLLATSRGTDGTVVRVLGRNSASSKLISARIAIDSVARLRMVVKVARHESIVGVRRRLEVHRVQISIEQAERLLDLLDKWRFWEAPYTLDRAPRDDGFAAVCTDSSGWLIEGVTPRAYQIMFRSNCNGLDPAAAEIRDFLLGLVNVSPDGRD